MKKVKRFALMVLLLIGAATTEAQEKELETTISADFVNQYIWRGQDLDLKNIPHINDTI